jgi:chromosomal replication initiation ATPase DnaA
MISQLNNEQLQAFDTTIEAVLANKYVFFFVSGYGGTGKTFLWNTIIAYLRAQKGLFFLLLHQELHLYFYQKAG